MFAESKKWGAPAAVVFGAVWVVAALIIDGSTFHLAPIIVTGAAVLSAAAPWRGAVSGIVVATAVGIGLELAGRLDGPSLLPWGDASLETVLGAAAGVLVGYLAAAAGVGRLDEVQHDR